MKTLGRSEIPRLDSACVHDEFLENYPRIDHPELQNVIADIFDSVSDFTLRTLFSTDWVQFSCVFWARASMICGG